jgi:broad specificity phosphatase PhoE
MKQPLFIVTRHGRTQGNEDDRYRGWSNEAFAQLAPEGRDDAREAALFIKRMGMTFPLILADDLARSQESQRIMASVLNIRELQTDKRLRSLDVGDYTGKPKDKHPLDEFMKNKSRKIPGGESMNGFDRRLSSVCADISELVGKLKKPILLIGHGSTISFLHNSTSDTEVGYEGLVHPGGVLSFSRDGIVPLFKRKMGEGDAHPLKDGTAVAGFVTDEENRPPRECWNCRNFGRELNGLGYCNHPLVVIDPQLQNRKQSDGTISVSDRDCCDNFRNKIST